jgi:hypothetical protein
MRHFTIILVVLNFSNCGFLLYSVYTLSFCDKKGEYFLFWTGNVFPNWSSVFFFVLEWLLFNKIIGYIQSRQVIWTVSHFMPCVWSQVYKKMSMKIPCNFQVKQAGSSAIVQTGL